MSAITLDKRGRSETSIIVGRFVVAPNATDQSENFEWVISPQRPRYVASGFSSGTHFSTRRLQLKGPLKQWCETYKNFVRISYPRRKHQQTIRITVLHRPELAVDFRMKFV